LKIPDVKLIVPKRFGDVRGYFSEIWSDRRFREEVANVTFVQDNQSMSAKKGTVRGLHFQKPPFAQGKLLHVVTGAIFDVAVDIRKGSPTYKQHVAIRLDIQKEDRVASIDPKNLVQIGRIRPISDRSLHAPKADKGKIHFARFSCCRIFKKRSGVRPSAVVARSILFTYRHKRPRVEGIDA
jgi:hypothetical protein